MSTEEREDDGMLTVKEQRKGKSKAKPLPGMEEFIPKRHEELDMHGAAPITAIDQRKESMEAVREEKETLLAIMERDKIVEYTFEHEERRYKIAPERSTGLKLKRLKLMPEES